MHSSPHWLKARDASACIELSVGVTCYADSLETEGLFTQESRPVRISAGRRVRMFDLECSDWSNGLRYHNFDTISDTEFKRPQALALAPVLHQCVTIMHQCIRSHSPHPPPCPSAELTRA